jgi:hypothetical protein
VRLQALLSHQTEEGLLPKIAFDEVQCQAILMRSAAGFRTFARSAYLSSTLR